MNKGLFFLISGVLFTSFVGTAQLTGESFRVHKTVVFTVPQTEATPFQKVGIADAVAIILPQDLTFIQGIEVEVKIPQIVASWQDSVAWTIYDTISPSPTENIIDYSGTSLTIGTLPSKLSWALDIPLIDTNTIKETPYVSKLTKQPNTKNGQLFIRFQQAMKGVPEEFGDAELAIAIKPLLRDLGRLVVHVRSTDNKTKPYTVFIDNEAYDATKEGILLPTGVHTLSIVSESYRNEVRTIHIDQAKTNTIDILMRDIAPTATVLAPANVKIFFDGSPIPNTDTPFTITEGDHTVRFTLGDYELVKTITATQGRSYTVSFEIDASVTESE